MNTKVYKRNEAIIATTKYFNDDELAANVWVNKYALKDAKGNLYELTPDDMHNRLADEIYRIEKKYKNALDREVIFNLLKDFKYIIPQGGPMSGIGNDKQIVSLSNCFVIGYPGQDSYGSIMKVDEEQVQLMKRRGGVGHDLSHLRPTGTEVENSALTSTGLPSFMERYSNSTREVGQDGRRGALMLSCSIDHPDAEGFIDAKLETGKVTGANISVRITDDYMKAVENDNDFFQTFPISLKSISQKFNAAFPIDIKDLTYNKLYTGLNSTYIRKIKAKELWDKIIHNAWKSAEPGILFWDSIIKQSIPDCYSKFGFATTSTNPCGEVPLCPFDSCRLLAINLYSYVENPFTEDAKFNWELFNDHAKYALRIMDDIVDIEIEKIQQIIKKIESDPEDNLLKDTEFRLWNKILEKAIQGRRTGVGVTAEGDMLAALGLIYGSDKATEFSEEVHKMLAVNAYKQSVELAKDRGKFELFDFDLEKDNPMIKRLESVCPELISDMKIHGRRNIALLTIAPTGTTSLMTQTTSGIEPTYLIRYKRRRKVNPNDKDVKIVFTDEVGDSWEEYNMFHPKFIDYLESLDYQRDEVEKLSDSLIDKLIKESPYYKATSNDVDWIGKVIMQGRIQKWVDHSISVTINMPKDVTEEMVSRVYFEAWKNGCKGVTVYRDGSRSGVLVSDNEKEQKDLANTIRENHSPKRPKEIEADVLRFTNKGEAWIGFVGKIDGKPYEIFTGRWDSFEVPKYVETGKIKKVRNAFTDKSTNRKRSRYDFIYFDKDGYEQIMKGLSRAFDREYWNIAKMLSAVLRHGMPLVNVKDLIESLQLEGSNFGVWKSGIIRMIKKYIKDGTKLNGKKCPECGVDALIYQDGCIKCINCGNSKCE